MRICSLRKACSRGEEDVYDEKAKSVGAIGHGKGLGVIPIRAEQVLMRDESEGQV